MPAAIGLEYFVFQFAIQKYNADLFRRKYCFLLHVCINSADTPK